jgi:hypothetical protein
VNLTPDNSYAQPSGAHALLRHAQESLLRDVQALTFDGTVITGKNLLVSIDLRTGKMYIRRAPWLKPFCHINLPTREGHEAMHAALMHPKLRGWGDWDGMDDLTAVLWAYVNIRIVGKPIDPRLIKLSPETAEYFASLFPPKKPH